MIKDIFRFWNIFSIGWRFRAILYRTPKFSLFTWIFGVLETVKSGLILYREWKKLRFFNLQVPTRNRCPLFYPLEKITPIPPSQFSLIFNLVRIFFGVRSKKWRSECFGRPLQELQKKNWRRFLKQKVKKLNFFLVNNGSKALYTSFLVFLPIPLPVLQ